MNSIDVSIIIVNWNTRELLRNCLESVYSHSDDVLFEVIVVDNASVDGSVAMIKSKFPKAIVISNDSNLGFAVANNQALRIAMGRYMLLLNSDTVVMNKAIGKVTAFADDHPEAAVVGCRVLNPDLSLQPTCFMFPSVLNLILSATYLYKLFPSSRFFGRERMSWWDRDNVRPVDVVTGCFMLVRRQAIEKVGMMDERFFVYGEETDFCYRFKQAGWEVLFMPQAKIIHLGGASTSINAEKMLLQVHASVLLFIKKHQGLPAYFIACFLTWLFFVLRIPVWAIRRLFSKGKDKIAQRNLKTYVIGALRVFRGAKGLKARG